MAQTGTSSKGANVSYIPILNKSPFAVALGTSTNRYNNTIEPASRSSDLTGSGLYSSDLTISNINIKDDSIFCLFQPSWERINVNGTLASYKTYVGAAQSEILHCRSDNGGDFYGGLDDTAMSPTAGVDFSAYSVLTGGWPSYVRFYYPRSSALVWFT